MQSRYAYIVSLLFWCLMAQVYAENVPPKLAAPQTFALALIDVETTGLDADVHEMIDIGAVYVDVDGRELGRVFIRINPAHPERAQAGAKAVPVFRSISARLAGVFTMSFKRQRARRNSVYDHVRTEY